MLKYLYAKEVFSEIPGEISLAISISGCTIHCEGCHSKELWKDKGIILGLTEFQWLLGEHQGITCVCLFGGEHDINALIELFKYAHSRIKTAWYCGLEEIPEEKQIIFEYLDFLKIGPYKKALGGLDRPTTNQRFYTIAHTDNGETFEDITYKFWKSAKE